MHRLLARQRKRLLAGEPAGLESFLAAVEEAYAQSDADMRLLQRALDLTSEELTARNNSLREQLEQQKEDAAQRELMLVVSRFLLEHRDLASITDLLPGLLHEHTGWQQTGLELHDASRKQMVLHLQVGASLKHFSVPASETVSGDVVANGEPVFAEDIQGHPRYRNHMLRKLGTRAFACVPMRAGSLVLGTVTLADRTVRSISDTFRTSLQVVASLLGEALAREHADQRMRVTQAAVDASGMAEYWVDRNGAIIHANHAASAMFGSSLSAVLGQPLWTVRQGLQAKHWASIWQDVQRQQRICQEAEYGEANDQSRQCIETLVAGSLRGEDCVVFLVQDVSMRKQAETTLRRSQAAFKGVMEGMTDPVIVHRQQTVVYANPAAVAYFGLASQDACQGQPVLRLLQPEDAEQLDQLERAMHGLPVEPNGLMRFNGPHGQLQAELSHLPLLFEGSACLMTVVRDVTLRRQMEARLAQAGRMASIGTLAAGIAHEINNPLCFVLGNAGFALDVASELKQELAGHPASMGLLKDLEDQLRDVHSGAERVAEIVKGMLSFSRVEDETPVSVDVNHSVTQAVNLASHHGRNRAALVADLTPVPPILGNQGRLTQVLLNLVVNAIQAMKDGGTGNNRVVIRTRHHEGRVTVEVEDNGVGIPAENLPRLFEPFFTTKPPGEGTGLGLSICHNIVTSYHGTLEAHSTRGLGTRFVMDFPVAQANVRALRPVPTPVRKAAEPPQSKKVLVIEDDRLVGTSLRRMLREHTVTTVESMVEAKTILQSGADFDVLLCDQSLAKGTGREMVTWLGSNRPDLLPRTVLMTGGMQIREAPVPVLYKPLDRGRVLAMLEHISGDASMVG